MRRGFGVVVLFAVAATAVAWAAWPGSPASAFAPLARVEVIVMVALAGLPVLARPFLGPAGDNRAARLLRAGAGAAFLAIIPGLIVVQQFGHTPPSGAADQHLYQLISLPGPRIRWPKLIVGLVILALAAAAIAWLTSRRARMAPATLVAGVSAGLGLGLVMYVVAPVGLSSAATNPWLPGSDVDPFVLLAWLFLLCGPAVTAIAVGRRYRAPADSPDPVRDKARQMIAAGLLTGLVGALSVAVAGISTTAVMVRASWLRDWLYHGGRLLYGVQYLSAGQRTLPNVAYSHALTGSVDAAAYLIMLLAFPFVATAAALFPMLAALEHAPAPAATEWSGAPGSARPAFPTTGMDETAG